MVTSFLYVRECVWSGLVLFSMWLTDGAVPWAREVHFLQKEPYFSIIRYRESMWVAMMTDSELFLQNWLQTVSVFQRVIKHMLINILIIELKDLRGSAEQYITGSSDTSPPCSLSLYREKF